MGFYSLKPKGRQCLEKPQRVSGCERTSSEEVFCEPAAMIKRRFFREEHGDRNEESDSSSSSSSFSETEIQESEDDEVSVPQVQQEEGESCSTSSGYESEESSGNEIHENASDKCGFYLFFLLCFNMEWN